MNATFLPEAALQLLGPDGPYTLGQTEIDGHLQTTFEKAPNSLADLYNQALAHADADFYVYENERYSFQDAYAKAQLVASALIAQGVKPGDRVGIALRNYPEWIWAFMGITSMGGIVVAMNAWWTTDEMRYGIEDSGLKVLFVDQERLDRIAELITPLGLALIKVRCDAQPISVGESFSHFIDVTPINLIHCIQPEDAATILYTSGSTAYPKGVLATHRSIIHALMGWEAAGALGQAVLTAETGTVPEVSPYQTSMILTVPLFHVTGMNVQLLSCFRLGRKLVGMFRWDPEIALAIIEKERITSFNGVPTMAWEMVQSANFHKYDLSSVKSMGGGGAAMAPEHARQIDTATNGAVAPGAGYGMTETNGLGTAIGGEALLERTKSCGKALPPVVSIQVVDETGKVLAAHQTGEICIRGAMNFNRYWNRPEDTAKTLVKGWVMTGDIGHLDEEGFVFITDRQKDMIIRGGENIGCQEVEATIHEHPKVLECAVFGLPDERLGETVAAAITPKPGVTLTAVEIQQHVTRHLAKFKSPAYVWIYKEQLPRIASGKIYKRGLREEAITKLKQSS